MSAASGTAVYCTLLLSDNYLPGAVVLAHSLRDNGTKAKLVALYTPDTLQPATVHELGTVYDELIPVHPTTNNTPANLWLMERPDLIATFTKIELWRQTQYKRIVYIDCDVVAVRAPDDLLTLEVDFAAAPDVGWPDCFNSGVMALRPNLQDYFALKTLAERGISFDGADQGLLNMHFRDWHRLSFAYNCTPSANYQYIPAYKHFQSTINMVHFIGAQKPWNMPRQISPIDSPYNQLLGQWWAIYDKHYRPIAPLSTLQAISRALTLPGEPQNYLEPFLQPSNIEHPKLVPQHHSTATSYETPTKIPSEVQSSQPLESQVRFSGDEHHAQHVPYSQSFVEFSVPLGGFVSSDSGQQSHQEEQHARDDAPQPVLSAVPQYVYGEEHVSTYIAHHPGTTTFVLHKEQPSVPGDPPTDYAETLVTTEPQINLQSDKSGLDTEQLQPGPEEPEHLTFQAPQSEWDASREPPPLNSRPEGIALEKKTYMMSDDNQLFQPPPSYPEAPKNMYYEVPKKKPEPQRLAQIFPWESHAPKPTRVFLNEEPSLVSTLSTKASMDSTQLAESSQSARSVTSWSSEENAPAPSYSWETYTRSNAWDEVPEIQKYIQSIRKPRKAKIQVLSGASSSLLSSADQGARGIRLTDFPTEEERPSLPVTPAPIRRDRSLPVVQDGGEGSTVTATDQFPTAEGVPSQEDWNPLARLEELQRRQSEVLDDPDFLNERIAHASTATAGWRRGSYE
ncbi:glycogenin glucosyltransferase [Aspergillus nanangensis]|uniref:glycogenin glucosyltransferase n=1 Tax=Aspergillus nanangensis TaxID=2582783 RepID=A0AAD4CZ86_ASPNN|nr:glycogenin glucosyltransferase [Aspergillus nanangensis]